MVLSTHGRTLLYTYTHTYAHVHVYTGSCGYRVFARRGDERREERMEEDPCHSVIGERTVPYRAVPCYIVSLCIVLSPVPTIFSPASVLFLFYFLYIYFYTFEFRFSLEKKLKNFNFQIEIIFLSNK